MQATRNNLGVSHENGSVESPHGHIKRRIKQALILRGSNNFNCVEEYQKWINDVVKQFNNRNAQAISLELPHLKPLPEFKAVDFTETCARVSTSATIDVRRATYTVPSRLIGENLRIHIYNDRLECYTGATHAVSLTRVHPLGKNKRARNIDYRHVIHSLVKKPQAFRHSKIRDDLLPNDDYKFIWEHIKVFSTKTACKLMVGLLNLAATHNCEKELAENVLSKIAAGKALYLSEFQRRYGKKPTVMPIVVVNQHSLSSYDALFECNHKEVVNG